MRRFLRKIFSPTLVAIMALILELVIVVAGAYFVLYLAEIFGEGVVGAENALVLYYVLTTLISLIIFFIIINKAEDPEFKIPWITFLMLFPITTSVMYLVFANHGMRKRDERLMKKAKEKADPYFTDEKSENVNALVEPDYVGCFNYLRNVTGLHLSSGNRLTYYKNGETFFPQFIEDLKKAKEFIFMEFFIIGEGKEWNQIDAILRQKAKEGVEVRLIFDDMGSFGLLPRRYASKLRKIGIKCYRFHPFRPILSGIYNNRDHRKIAVIDHQIGYTGGMNLADEYANDIVRFGYWKDTMIKIEGEGINNLINMFLTNFDLACGKSSDYGHYLDYKYEKFEENAIVFPFGDGPGSFDGNYMIGEQNYVNIINAAKKELWISTPYLIPTNTLLEALKNAALRGVDVKLFIPGIPDKKVVYWLAKAQCPVLLKAGVHVYTYMPGFNHEKEMLADDKIAFVGTINFDFRSLVHHFECGATLYKSECIKDIRKDFEEMQSVSTEIPNSFRVSSFKRLICAILKLFASLL